ncbi:cytochrome-c peroxidase [Veronia nyctiphanis]|uniref:Cytochrome-c peroxidase n=1 Tax=Veronia nyctiphanis TaxID=1278244 RepID=A0A4Q0YX03_9GAMM|nr:cytochrome c peroxidase [Veronia nyctiphanis]RXJ73581.1 cytochrome-c peroxidase [Veronia nyctiphanis]
MSSMKGIIRMSLFGIVINTLTGCDLFDKDSEEKRTAKSNNGVEQNIANQVRAVARSAGVTSDAADGVDIPNIKDPLPQLGMRLFFSKALSGNKDTACATCHHPTMGGGDNLPLSIGVDSVDHDVLGVGRLHRSDAHEYDGGPPVPRNAPTSFNMALWDDFIFHDGRIESMAKEVGQNGASDTSGIVTPDNTDGGFNIMVGKNLTMAQSRFPVTSKEEMKGFDVQPDGSTQDIRDLIINRLIGRNGHEADLEKNDWLTEFRIAYDVPNASAEEIITDPNMFNAIAEYERSLTFTNSPWTKFLEGDDTALNDNARSGAILFFKSASNGGAGCVTCHSGNNLTDERFHVLAVPQIGRGKEANQMDQGRWYVTKDDDDRFAFRTPSLLNVSVTGPWGHSGAYSSLDAMVRHHLNPEKAVRNYDYSQLPSGVQVDKMFENTGPAIIALNRLREKGKSKLPEVSLSDDEINDLIAFLEALTDPCVTDRECMSSWIPTGNDPDGLRLIGKDINGNLL